MSAFPQAGRPLTTRPGLPKRRISNAFCRASIEDCRLPAGQGHSIQPGVGRKKTTATTMAIEPRTARSAGSRRQA
jgi:hypothetical protein